MPTEIKANCSDPILADEEDSGIDNESGASSTQSLTESILQHVYENGRRYHAKSVGRYHMPSDEKEQDRLDLHHHNILQLLGGRLTMAPFEHDPNMVLDCGTGTGIWALDFADCYPASTVVGIDLAPIQPNYVYPNVKFELDDLEMDWTFNYQFDLIHSRNMATSIKNWPRYFEQMYDFANAGGYVELTEHDMNAFRCDDGTMPEDSAYGRWLKPTTAAMKKAGLSPYQTLKDYTTLLEDAGFEIVQTLEYKVPCGGWPKGKKEKYLGFCWAEDLKTGFESYSKALLVNGGGLAPQEADDLIAECLKTLAERKQHVYYYTWHIVARKPL
ncbi:S-adenosyl-L-methionine-dependent methyltransferase [Ascodesmis nigricans]|uniref:S-adenosyl-L-methionine-dependent methyltransferase n=1 Tax=Ascodesmis nigricans TaxID=341454 RepID=A0A4S2MJJ9_9PEZI|nr:S-adenosyl-L-methionine-dependent methyltransferase [Ascodesmis nigricans]